MQYIIPNVHVYEGNNCIYTSIKNLFKHYNYNMSETDIYFLCNGIDLWFNSAGDLNSFGYKNVANTIRNISESTSVDADIYWKKDEDGFFEKCVKAITENKIVLLMVGTSKLTYHDIYKENESRAHSILLYGFDKDKNLAYIGDSCIKDYSGKICTFQGPVQISEVEDNTFLYGWFDLTNSKPITEAEIIQKTVVNFEKFIRGYSYQEDYFGNLACKKFLEKLDDLADLEDKIFSELCTNIYYKIKIVTILPVIEFMSEFIKEHKVLQLDGHDDILSSLNRFYAEWSKFAIMFLKMGKTGKKTQLDSLLRNRHNIISLQEQVLSDYIDFIKKAQSDYIV